MEDYKKQYEMIIENGIPVFNIYIYQSLIEDDRTYNMTDKEIADMTDRVIDIYNHSGERVEDIIYRLLECSDQDEFDEWYN